MNPVLAIIPVFYPLNYFRKPEGYFVLSVFFIVSNGESITASLYRIMSHISIVNTPCNCCQSPPPHLCTVYRMPAISIYYSLPASFPPRA